MWRLAEDTLCTAEIHALADWLKRGERLTQGEKIKQFERAWASWVGSADSVFVSSGTTANFALVACAAELVERDTPRVGVSAVTWSTNVSPSLLMGHEVVVFDVDPRTLGLDEAQVCAAIEADEIDILFVTHLLGLDALTPTILATAEEHGVIVLEDCCESHGARHGAAKVGTLGLGGTFSFYFGHHMSTIEGGAICTDDAAFADRLRLMRAHGLARESANPAAYAAQSPNVDPRFLFVATGLNFRSTELNAFLGLGQIPLLDERIETRNRNMQRFLAGAPSWLRTDFHTAGMSSFALPLIAHDAEGAARAREVTDALGIESRPVVAGNLMAHPFMQGPRVRVAAGGLPHAEAVHAFGHYVGNGHHVTDAMVDELCAALRA
ncbi:MAG: DegT/DnrJ/EryC1/StrS aminotransferase family protein [Planctomycetota bacterium]|nr:DegT/DnrJ/EryC1/StrS aminotransferase family protein [Planctomycetota bacterium]